MRNLSFLFLLSSLMLFGLCSCEEDNTLQKQWTKEHVRAVLDSIGASKVIASFNEDDCFNVLVFDNEERKIVKNLIYRPGYPIFIDTLIYIKQNKFKSQCLNTTYFINDSSVVTIQHIKIIHPSSNWQGQTPWQQPYVNTYLRTDRK